MPHNNVNSLDNFMQAMNDHGLLPPEIIPDGKIHRFQEGDKRNKNGWYVFLDNGITQGGAFGNWKDVDEKWSSKAYTSMSDAEKESFRQQMEQGI